MVFPNLKAAATSKKKSPVAVSSSARGAEGGSGGGNGNGVGNGSTVSGLVQSNDIKN